MSHTLNDTLEVLSISSLDLTDDEKMQKVKWSMSLLSELVKSNKQTNKKQPKNESRRDYRILEPRR